MELDAPQLKVGWMQLRFTFPRRSGRQRTPRRQRAARFRCTGWFS